MHDTVPEWFAVLAIIVLWPTALYVTYITRTPKKRERTQVEEHETL